VVARRTITGVVVAGGLTVLCAIAPAMGADEGRSSQRITRTAQSPSIGSFTPASADPRLAALMARAGAPASGFRFTPAGSGRDVSRAVTVAVRARSTQAAATVDRTGAAQSPVALTPLAYNLGVAVGWKRFALSGDLAKVDLAGLPGSREAVDLGVSYSGKSFSGRVKAGADRPLANQPKMVAEVPSVSLDVGGSYSISRNFDLTAGVRYKSERERLPQLTDNRRDSQSVYLGTAFRF
jgi:hypothetical protein